MRIPYRPRTQVTTQGAGAKVPPTLMAQAAQGSAPIWKGFGDAAEALTQHAEAVQDSENLDTVMTQQLAMAQDYADFQVASESVKPSEVSGLFSKMVIDKANKRNTSDLPPVVREEMKRHIYNYQKNQGTQVAISAGLRQHKQTRDTNMTLFRMSLENQQWDKARQWAESAKRNNIVNDVQYGQMMDQVFKSERDEKLMQYINEAPFEAAESIKKGQLMSGMSQAEKDKFTRYSTQKRDKTLYEFNSEAVELIAGDSVNSLEELEKAMGGKWGKLSAKNKNDLLSYMAKQNDLKQSDRMKGPEQQAAIYDRLDKILGEEIDLGEEGRNDLFAEYKTLIDWVQNKGDKEDYDRRFYILKAKYHEGVELEEKAANDKKKLGLEILDNMRERGEWGKVDEVKPKKETLGDYVDYLQSAEFYRSAGFSKEQAGGDNSWIFKSITGKAADGVSLTPKEAIKKLQEDWSKRKGEPNKVSFSYKIAKLFAEGKPLSTVVHERSIPADVLDKQRRQEDAVILKHYNARQALNKFLETDQGKNATPDEVVDFARTYGASEGAIKQAKETLLAPKPVDLRLKLKGNYLPAFSNPEARKARAESGGATILLDSNKADGVAVTSPLVVIPDNATPEQEKAAWAYANGVAAMQLNLGRELKPRVVKRSQNGRGRSNAFHTEGFAVTDKAFISWLKTPAGRKEYMQLLDSTLGALPNSMITLPHGPTKTGAIDKGAESDGVNEVDLARYLMQGKWKQ